MSLVEYELLDYDDDDRGINGCRDRLKLKLDFVWETTCEKSCRDLHNSSGIINKLHNTHIVESKSNLAFLQIVMNSNSITTLQTFVAYNGTDVRHWANKMFIPTVFANLETPNESSW